MVRKGFVGAAKLGLTVTFLAVVSVFFVFYVIPVIAANFSPGPSTSSVESGSSNELINISVNNNATTPTNITNITIQLPSSNFTIISDSNTTTVTPSTDAYFSNTTLNLTWWNTTTRDLVNSTQYFSFNVSVNNGEEAYTFLLFTIHSDGTSNSTSLTISTNDSLAPGINDTRPVPGSYISSLSSVLFQVNVTDHNLNETTLAGAGNTSNASLFYRASGVGSYTSHILNCFAGSPNWTCNTTIDLSVFVADGETLQYFFNATDSSGVGGNNGTWDSPLTVTVDSSVPYQLDFAAPTPSDDSFNTSATPTINATFVEPNIDSCVFEWSNGTAANYTNSSPSNASCSYTFSSTVEYPVNVTVYVNDSAGNYNVSATLNFTTDSITPALPAFADPTLSNGSYTTADYLQINATFNETNPHSCVVTVSNASAVNYSGSITGSGSSAYCFFNASTFANGVFNFTVFVNDSAGVANTTSTRYVTFDNTTPAAVDYTGSTPSDGSFTTDNTPTFYLSFTETNPYNCIFQFSNGSAQNLTNSSPGASDCTLTLTSQPDLPVNVTAFVNDSAGYQNATALRNFTIDADQTDLLDYDTSTLSNGSYSTLDYIYINATFNETYPHTCLVEFGNVTTANYTGTITGSGSSAYCFFNASTFANGVFNFTVFVNDTAGVANTTVRRFITIDNTTPASLSFAAPSESNSSFTTNTSPIINVSFTETNPHNCIFQFSNGSAVNYTNSTIPGGNSCSFQFITTTDFAVNATVFVNDSAGYQTATSYLNFTVDDVIPNTIDYVNPTLSNGTFSSLGYLEFNVTLNETNPSTCLIELANGTPTNYSGSITGSGSNAYCFLNGTSQPDGPWNFTTHVTDASGAVNSTVRRFVVVDTTSPLIRDITPANASNLSTSSNVLFQVELTEQNLNTSHNITLSYRRQGIPTFTNVTLGCYQGPPTYTCNTSIDISGIIGNGQVLEYYFSTIDLASQSSSNGTASAPLTVDVDTGVPGSLDFVSPTVSSGSFNKQTYAYINVSGNEANPDSCIFEWSNGTATNYTTSAVGTGTATSCGFNFTSITPDHPVNVTVYMNDTAGNANTTTLLNFTLDALSVNLVDFISPSLSNGSYTTLNYLQINTSFNETYPHSCVVTVSNASAVNYSGSITGSGSSAYCFFNASLTGSGPWNYSVFLNDTSGSSNVTNTHYVTYDNTTPAAVDYTGSTPSDGSFTADNTPTFYLSFTETNPHNCIFQFSNGSAQNLTNSSPGASDCTLTLTSQPDLPVNVTAFVNDSAGYQNATTLRNFTIDADQPSAINFVSPTYGNGSGTTIPYLEINASFNETYPHSCVVTVSNASAVNYSGSITGSGSSAYCFFNASLTGSGPWNFSVFVNDTAGVGNTSATRFVTYDNTTFGLLQWNYSFVNKTLALLFNTAVDMDSLNVSQLNITDNQSSLLYGLEGLNESGSTTVALSGGDRILTFVLTDTENARMKILDGQCGGVYGATNGQLDLSTAFLNSISGVNITAVSNQGFENLTRWSVEVNTCESLTPGWHTVHDLSAIRITNITSLGGNYTPQKVLESIAGNYTSLFYYNTSQSAWTSFVLGNNASTITTIGSVDQPYHIKMNVTDKIQIQ